MLTKHFRNTHFVNTRSADALAAWLQAELADTCATRRHEFVVDSGHYIHGDWLQPAPL